MSNSMILAVVLSMTALMTQQASALPPSIGTFVLKKGSVKVLTPTKAQSANQKYLIFNNQKYTFQTAKLGQKVRPFQVIQTGSNGKAKIIYPNGDHLMIGPGSTLTLPGERKTKSQEKSSLKVIYGKLRALISKKGPRKNLDVKTKSAVAGIRGTDFFINHHPSQGTQVTVIRGAVQLEKRQVVDNKDSSQAQPKKSQQKRHSQTRRTSKQGMKTAEPEVERRNQSKQNTALVRAGFTGSVQAVPPKKTSAEKEASQVELVEATKEKLLQVQTQTTIRKEEVQEEIRTLSKETQDYLNNLEQKASQAVQEDIKSEDPALYEAIENQKLDQSESINTFVVSELFKKAPSENLNQKPSQDEIDALGQDVYEKYFKDPND